MPCFDPRCGLLGMWALVAALACGAARGATPATRPSADVPLPTGRVIMSSPQGSAGVGSMPLNMVVTADHQFVITTSAGYRDELTSVRIADGATVSVLDFPNTKKRKKNGLYYGIALTADGLVYAAQGANHSVAVARVGKDGVLQSLPEIPEAASDFSAGLAVASGGGGGRLFITQNDPEQGENRSARRRRWRWWRRRAARKSGVMCLRTSTAFPIFR